MNPINKKALKLTETTQDDFLDYCQITKKGKSVPKTRRDYFGKILDNTVVRDTKTNKIKVLKEK